MHEYMYSGPMPRGDSDRPGLGWPIVLVSSLLLYVAVLLTGIGGPIRLIMGAWFLLVCPGLALVPLVRLRDPLVELVLVLSVSLALDLLVSLALFYSGVWTWQRAVAVLGYVALSGAAAQVVRSLQSSDAVDATSET